MNTFHKRLFNVPQPEAFEAVSSWLSRLALSQGVSPNEIMRLLGKLPKYDIDRYFYGDELSTLKQLCGLPDQSFQVHDRIMTSLNSMLPVGRNYLLLDNKNNPSFRFCPLCIKEMRTYHLPIHWRFIAWRRCPIHDCILEDQCLACKSNITYPVDIVETVSGQEGYVLQNRCLNCSLRLDTISPCFLQFRNHSLVSDFEEIVLKNGRALLAALYHQEFMIRGLNIPQHLKKFKNLVNSGFIPIDSNWLNREVIEGRRISLTEGRKTVFLNHKQLATSISGLMLKGFLEEEGYKLCFDE